jgi:hypothetical protein
MTLKIDLADMKRCAEIDEDLWTLALLDLCESMRVALEFYGDPRSWSYRQVNGIRKEVMRFDNEADSNSQGKRARKALEKYRAVVKE